MLIPFNQFKSVAIGQTECFNPIHLLRLSCNRQRARQMWTFLTEMMLPLLPLWYVLQPHNRFWVQHHCCTYKSQVCNNLSDLMQVQTTNKTHYIITMSRAENLYLEETYMHCLSSLSDLVCYNKAYDDFWVRVLLCLPNECNRVALINADKS